MTGLGQSIDFAATFDRLAREGESETSASLGGISVRMVRVAGGGAGRWDRHAHTTETAIVWSGDFAVEFRDRTVLLSAGQCCVVPADTEHCGTSRDGAEVILLTQAG